MSMASNCNPSVTVLLGAYNGARFIEEQIASINRAEAIDWRLLVRDDGSSDDTATIVRRLARADERIIFIEDERGNLGTCNNFSLLAEFAMAKGDGYVAFADQDDQWLPEKLSRQMAVMAAVENLHPGLPVLVHTDLEVVDGVLRPIAKSFMRYQGIGHEAEEPHKVLLVQNFVTGCTVLVNRRLEVALPIPETAVLHDWWLALCAAVFGRIAFVDLPLVRYRQHGENQVGVKPWIMMFNPFGGLGARQWYRGLDNMRASMRQAGSLALRIRQHADAIPTANRHLRLVEEYAGLAGLSPLARFRWISRAGVHSQNGGRQLLLLARLMLG